MPVSRSTSPVKRAAYCSTLGSNGNASAPVLELLSSGAVLELELLGCETPVLELELELELL